MSFKEALDRVNRAAEAEAAGEAMARETLLKELRILTLAVETPAETAMRIRFQPLQSLCIRMATGFGLLQALCETPGKVMTAEELGEQTGVNPNFVVRIMRLVTFSGTCDEKGPGAYASNEVTAFTILKGSIGGTIMHTDQMFGAGTNICEKIRKQGLKDFPDGADQTSLFMQTHGMPMFEYLKHNNEAKRAFDDFMIQRRMQSTMHWTDRYPIEERLSIDLKTGPEAVLLVDMGGGKGHDLMNFRKLYPDAPGKLLLQDLKETLENNDSPPEGVVLMKHDFFTPQPIKGARFYYMRAIMHDWTDKECQQILKQIVDAMDKGYSRILIEEFVLPESGVDMRAASLDITLLMLHLGRERTEAQWKKLISSVGLELVDIFSKPGCESVIEARIPE